MPINTAQPHKKIDKTPIYIEKFNILIILLILLIIVPGYLFFIKPVYSSYIAAQKQFKNLDQQREINLRQLLDLKRTIANDGSITGLEKAKINQILPDKIDEASLYVNIESLVNAAGLTLQGLDISPVVKRKKRPTIGKEQEEQAMKAAQLGTVDINLDVTNVSYSKLKQFFDLLENNLRLIDVQEFSFASMDGGLKINMRTYYLKF